MAAGGRVSFVRPRRARTAGDTKRRFLVVEWKVTGLWVPRAQRVHRDGPGIARDTGALEKRQLDEPCDDGGKLRRRNDAGRFEIVQRRPIVTVSENVIGARWHFNRDTGRKVSRDQGIAAPFRDEMR